MERQRALVYYLDHSGFAVKINQNMLIFDYIGRHAKPQAGLADGILERQIWQGVQNTYVFASHNHGDHFQPGIFQLKDYADNTVFILDRDIPTKKGLDCISVCKGDVVQRDNMVVTVCGSTDIGSSFFVDIDGWKLFHAGDLNCWHWQGEADERYMQEARMDFAREIAYVKQQQKGTLDIGFFPVDDRMEGVFYEGADAFIRQLQPRHFFAMHFWGRYQVQKKLEAQKYPDTQIHTIDKKGEKFVIEK